jgi:[ribosomal protein S5]-alanine N-acetyltransferase
MDRLHEPGWAIVREGRVIGGVVLFFDFGNRSAEIGYSVARRHWNQGFCTEAVSAVVDLAFCTHEDLNRVWARTDPANVASRRVLEKVGMGEEGILRLNRVYDGVAFDEVYFSILRSEWEA